MNNKNLYDEGEINEDEEEEEDSEIIENNDGEYDEEYNEASDQEKTIRTNIVNAIRYEEDNNKEEEEPKKTKEDNALIEIEQKSIETVEQVNIKKVESKHNSNEELISFMDNKDSNMNESNQKKSLLKMPLNNNESVEMEKDFDVALTKILSKMVKEADNNNEIYDILLSDKDKVEEELNKYEFAKRVNINEKIKGFLEKKEKNIKSLEDKIEEELKKQCTFAPYTNSTSQSKQRNLSQFLKDQETYQKKLNEKLTNLKDAQQQEEIKELKQKPQICNTSSKVAKNKNKGEEVHQRLYKKRAQTTTSTNNNGNNNGNNNEKNITPTKKTSCNININLTKTNKAKFEHLYQEAKNRDKRIKEKENQQTKEMKEALQYKSNVNSNKYLFKRFKKIYKEEVENVLSKNNLSQPQLTFPLLKELLTNLNFYPNSKANEVETQLLNEINDNLKKEDDSMSIEHIFIFCLSILNLLEYYLLSSYQKDVTIANSSSQQTLKTSQSGKTLKTSNSQSTTVLDDNVNELKKKLDLDLNNRIVTQKKYGGYDNEGNFIISLTHAKLIFKDFSVLYQNYSQNNAINKNKKNNNGVEPPPFKPTINHKSNQLLNKKNKQKQIKDLDKNNNIDINTNNLCEINNHNNNDSNAHNNKANGSSNSNSKSNSINSNSRIDMLYLESTKKKHTIEQNEKLKREKEEKELEACTFKPKINSDYPMKDNIYPINQSQTIEHRVEMLYKKGTEQISHKKNKSRAEMDFEKSVKDCTFKPIVHEVNHEIFDKKYSVCQDDDLLKFNERLKNGRFEREFKGSFLERGEFAVLPRNKSENKILLKKMPATSISNLTRKTPKTDVKPKVNKKKEDQVPLLQIDVNLKNGVKKNVFVFEGDTAAELAENFAIENHLEENMKKKLKSLIQVQIDKLLMKIAEESNTSYKSNTNT